MPINYLKITKALKRSFFIAFILAAQVLTCATRLHAQENNIQKEYDVHTFYTHAEYYYGMGYFDAALELIDKIKASQDVTMRSSAYRLKALCHIELGDLEKARQDVQDLLNTDPYFSPSASDNPIFLNFVNTTKHQGSATITTASQQAETIEEAPVPVTLITEEMLQDIGARTLQDALTAYVPGMTCVASNEEMNIAMRGIYSSSQEKILILLNGHRLNSYSTNAATPDFSISLEKVKQIEVLRGPASSIYGGVALTAVINIITKDGLDVNGFRAKASVGNYGQLKGDLLFGKRYMGLDIFAWLGVYNASGEKRHLMADEQPYAAMPVEGDIILGGYNKQPSYDFGATLSYNDFHIMYNHRFSKTVAPYALSYIFAPYSYEKYRKWNGNSPGYAIESQHAEIGYDKQLGDFSLLAKAFYDRQIQQRYQVGGDTIPEIGFNDIYLNGVDDVIVKMYRGGFQSVNSRERTFGFKIQGNLNYRLSGSQHGNILFGGEYSRFDLYDATYMEGIDFDLIIKTFNTDKVLLTGNESSADAYVQVKHNLGKHFIVNGGLRYDYKLRRTHVRINEMSPRIAIIYNNSKLNVKFSYSKAFVDAPYFYRSNNFDINYGNETLNPEKLHSYQLSFLSDRKLIKNMFLDLNIFLNSAKDFIIPAGTGNLNGGKFTSTGVEFIARYACNKLMLETNMTWQRLLDSEFYNTYETRIYNIPEFKWNVIAKYQILKGLYITANTTYRSDQTSYNVNPEMGTTTMFEIPKTLILNAGINYKYRNIGVGLDVYNLLNTHYVLGGSSVAPIQQQGRWILGSVSFDF